MMAIRVNDKDSNSDRKRYKTNRGLLTEKDIKEADKFEKALRKNISEIESTLIGSGLISAGAKKQDPLMVWYEVGKKINAFLKKNKLKKEDEDFFWDSLYGKSDIIHKTNLSHPTRNDYKMASIIATYPYSKLKKGGPWALWREALTYRPIREDRRVFDWLVSLLSRLNVTRDEARPILKLVGGRFKKIDTEVLSSSELEKKLKELEEKINEVL
ncbi:MAG: hypothetical protein PHW75_01555 [Patescibacteria group bacterium]|nr:hypothetical protein [Patescibacteria group bacterium]